MHHFLSSPASHPWILPAHGHKWQILRGCGLTSLLRQDEITQCRTYTHTRTHTHTHTVTNIDAHACATPIRTHWHTDWLILWWACLWHTDCATLQQQSPPPLPPPLHLPPSQPPLVSMQFLAEKPLPCIPPPLPPLEDRNEGQEEKDGKRMCGGHREETWPPSVLGNVKDICCFFPLVFNNGVCIYRLHPFVLCLCVFLFPSYNLYFLKSFTLPSILWPI